jgi:hypothetical protein
MSLFAQGFEVGDNIILMSNTSFNVQSGEP